MFAKPPSKPPAVDHRHIDPDSESGQIMAFERATNFVLALADLMNDPKALEKLGERLKDAAGKTEEIKSGLKDLVEGRARLDAYRAELVDQHSELQKAYDSSVAEIAQQHTVMEDEIAQRHKDADVEIQKRKDDADAEIKKLYAALDKKVAELQAERQQLEADQKKLADAQKKLAEDNDALDERRAEVEGMAEEVQSRIDKVSKREQASIAPSKKK